MAVGVTRSESRATAGSGTVCILTCSCWSIRVDIQYVHVHARASVQYSSPPLLVEWQFVELKHRSVRAIWAPHANAFILQGLLFCAEQSSPSTKEIDPGES